MPNVEGAEQETGDPIEKTVHAHELAMSTLTAAIEGLEGWREMLQKNKDSKLSNAFLFFSLLSDLIKLQVKAADGELHALTVIAMNNEHLTWCITQLKVLLPRYSKIAVTVTALELRLQNQTTAENL